jgi:hypothetical protein
MNKMSSVGQWWPHRSPREYGFGIGPLSERPISWSMLKSPLPRSEELLRQIKDALGPNRKPLLIAIDGPDGVGKSSLASWLAWQLGMPTVHLDLYAIRGSRPLRWRTAEVDLVIQARLSLGMPVIVEGMLIVDVLDQISRSPDFLHTFLARADTCFPRGSSNIKPVTTQ